jgi:hypothetical protein
MACARLRLDGDFACQGEYADVKGEGCAMPEVFDDELTDADLDELEALGAAEDADVILAQVGEEDA